MKTMLDNVTPVTCLLILLTANSFCTTSAAPVQNTEVITELETSMVASAANYMFGRWFGTATTSTSAPPADLSTSSTVPPNAQLPSTTLAPLPRKQSVDTELTEVGSYPILNLFMILIRTFLDNSGSASPRLSASPQQPTQGCNCPPVRGQPQQQAPTDGLQSSLTQTAMKALLMVVSDALSTQFNPSSAPSPTSASSGFFW